MYPQCQKQHSTLMAKPHSSKSYFSPFFFFFCLFAAAMSILGVDSLVHVLLCHFQKHVTIHHKSLGKVGIKFLDKNCLIYQETKESNRFSIAIGLLHLKSTHTPCGRYAANLPQGECEFQMDKCLFCNSIRDPHSLCTTYWFNLPQIEGVEISCGCLKGANPFEINTTSVKCLQ